VADELFARAAALVAVLVPGEAVGLNDPSPVDRQDTLRLAFIDDRKQLRESVALGRIQRRRLRGR